MDNKNFCHKKKWITPLYKTNEAIRYFLLKSHKNSIIIDWPILSNAENMVRGNSLLIEKVLKINDESEEFAQQFPYERQDYLNKREFFIRYEINNPKAVHCLSIYGESVFEINNFAITLGLPENSPILKVH